MSRRFVEYIAAATTAGSLKMVYWEMVGPWAVLIDLAILVRIPDDGGRTLLRVYAIRQRTVEKDHVEKQRPGLPNRIPLTYDCDAGERAFRESDKTRWVCFNPSKATLDLLCCDRNCH